MIEKKTLSLIHIEVGTKLFDAIREEGGMSRIVAAYLATPALLRQFKTDPHALDEIMTQVEEMPATDTQEIVTDFFGQWSGYQGSILNSMTQHAESLQQNAEKMIKVKTIGETPLV